MSFFNLKFNKNNSNKRGLTMVETLVAISILTIAVVGPLGIIAQALHSSYYTRDQMTAYYLAQEAVEYVRNLRDTEGIAITKIYVDDPENTDPHPWLDTVLSSTTPSIYPFINPVLGSNPTTYSLVRDNVGVYKFVGCAVDGCDHLKLQDGVYGTDNSAASDSNFVREIYFRRTPGSPGDSQEFMMVVNVYWKTGSYQAKLTLKEYFTNWTSKTGS